STSVSCARAGRAAAIVRSAASRMPKRMKSPVSPYDFRVSAEPSSYRVPAGTGIGHVHLKVADIDRALAFYQGVLGFDLVTRLGDNAAFVSAGGYHHQDRKSTRLNSSHVKISYAVFCLKKKKEDQAKCVQPKVEQVLMPLH